MIKTMKRILALLITAALCLMTVLPAFAAGSGTIIINKAVKGQTYNAYKIFDVTYEGENFAYSIKKTDNKFFGTIENFANNEENGMKLTLQSGSTDTYNATVDSDKFNDTKAGELAVELSKVTDKGTATGTEKASASGTCTISNLEAGYYFVDTTTGTLCSLDTVTESANIDEKNLVPTLDKQVKKADSEYDDSETASIGDELDFRITITARKGAQNYVLNDKMTKGLTFIENSVKVQYQAKGSGELSNWGTDDYTLSVTSPVPTDGAEFAITIKKALNEGDKIIVTYKARLNKDAEIYYEKTVDENGQNINTAKLHYGEEPNATVDDKVTVYSYMFDLVKTDKDKRVLSGAEFKLYGSKDENDEIKVKKVEDDKYQVIDPNDTAEGVAIEAGFATIEGLGKGKYYLEETKAPNGYNRLTSRVDVSIIDTPLKADFTTEEDNKTYTSGGVQVVNESGKRLPSTGGMGTTIFYILGSVLVVGAGVLLVVKRRMRDEER